MYMAPCIFFYGKPTDFSMNELFPDVPLIAGHHRGAHRALCGKARIFFMIIMIFNDRPGIYHIL